MACGSEWCDEMSCILLHPTWDVNHFFVSISMCTHSPLGSDSAAISAIGSTVVVLQCLSSSYRILFNNGPKYIHRTCIIMYFYNCSVLLFLLSISFWSQFVSWTLSWICMCRKKHSIYTGFNTIHGFSHPLGVLEHIPVDRGGLAYSLYHKKKEREIILTHKSPSLLLFVQSVHDSPSATFKTETLMWLVKVSPMLPFPVPCPASIPDTCWLSLANNCSHMNVLCSFPT